jgi:hypothetical protein
MSIIKYNLANNGLGKDGELGDEISNEYLHFQGSVTLFLFSWLKIVPWTLSSQLLFLRKTHMDI